ncbi:MAG: hypothetical protein ACLTTF_08765 [Oscillospiraceae bacterium]
MSPTSYRTAPLRDIKLHLFRAYIEYHIQAALSTPFLFIFNPAMETWKNALPLAGRFPLT